MMIRDGERLDYVNDDLSLIQKSEGLTFGTDALLLAGYVQGKYDSAVEIGGGSGIISMLLLTRGKVQRITAIEVQAEYAELIERNASLNSLTDRLTAVHADAREYTPDGECALVFSNPPYMRADSGRACASDKKQIARHEVNGDIRELVAAGARMLKYGGDMVTVYRPDRLADLIDAYRAAGVEPKRMTFVHASAASAPSMLLLEGKRGGKSGMRVTRPLIIYESDGGTYTADMNYIMENGAFPDGFGKNG